MKDGACIPIRIHTIVISTQHDQFDESFTLDVLRKEIMEKVVKVCISYSFSLPHGQSVLVSFRDYDRQQNQLRVKNASSLIPSLHEYIDVVVHALGTYVLQVLLLYTSFTELHLRGQTECVSSPT